MSNNSKNVLQRGIEHIHSPFSNFIRSQTTSSIFLLFATVIALLWANSDNASSYEKMIHYQIGFILGDYEFSASLKHIVNDGLMVIFFFILGLEIKREILAGDLSKSENRRMLVVCAMGGMICPALIYFLINWSVESQIGWGIPMATDTAFALGVLTIIRKHIPTSLLAFIVGLAIVDDVGAILVIAIFYSQEISTIYLISALLLIAFLAIANYAGIRQPFFYLIIGVIIWYMMLKSGVHATVAGVAIALTIPARPKYTTDKLLKKAHSKINAIVDQSDDVDVLGNKDDHEKVLEVRDYTEHASTPLRRWEDALDLPVALLILPLFALTNAGVEFNFNSLSGSFSQPIGLGILMGLVVGKLIGISGACWVALKFNIGCLPKNVNLQHVIGASFFAGIGFTMSTFIASLGFHAQPDYLHMAKTSILISSVIAAILGVLYIRLVASNLNNKAST